MKEEYPKINTIFERDPKTKKIVEGKFISDEFKYLKDLDWEFTEKIDGTNIRIYWDGYKVSFYGRTDNSQIPSDLVNRLIEKFSGEANEELFEQKFGKMEVMLFCEGCGGKIQGLNYFEKQDIVLFDVMIDGKFQPRDSITNIAEYFGILRVPILFTGTLGEGVDYVKENHFSFINTDIKMEGLVGRPKVELQDRVGNRMIVKIKWKDFS